MEGLVTLETCHAVVSRYAMNEGLCVAGVACYVNIYDVNLCVLLGLFKLLLCDLSFLYFLY